jgi:hypothetical protein
MDKQGIVLSPPFKPLYTGGIQCGGDPDPLDLRKYLMYWDEIDYPTNNLIHISSPDIDYLESTGALKRTRISFMGAINSGRGEFFVTAQEAALRHNQEKEPGCWNLAQLSGVPFYTQQSLGLVIDFELYGMLPIPSIDTPLSDVLEFKESRRDELIAFRVHLSEIYQSIISSADIPRAKNTELTKLESAIRDLDKALSESVIERTVSNIRNTINVDFSGIVGAGLGAAGISSLIGMSPLLAGMAAAGLVVGFKSLTMPSLTNCPAQYSYINSIRSSFQC